MGIEIANGGGGLRGRPVVLENQELAVTHMCSRSNSFELSHKNPGKKGGGGSREKQAERKMGTKISKLTQ